AAQFPRGRHFFNIVDAGAMPGVFANVAAYAQGGLNLGDPEHPRRVKAGVVTTGFFATLGVPPRFGRTFTDEEGKPRAANVAILSDALWHSVYGGSDVIGRTIDLRGTKYSVVGIMPPRFGFPKESD